MYFSLSAFVPHTALVMFCLFADTCTAECVTIDRRSFFSFVRKLRLKEKEMHREEMLTFVSTSMAFSFESAFHQEFHHLRQVQ